MRIAQIAPLMEACPPRFYGGTERVVSYLTDELVRLGHDVTLFASGDSRTSARLEACCRSGLRLDPRCKDPITHHLAMLHRVRRRAAEFDILHFHTDYLHFPLFADCAVPTVTTLHGRLDLPDLPIMMQEFPELPLVSISDAQRHPIPWASWCATVAHGLPMPPAPADRRGGGYLAFLGRISPEKRPDRAIAIARGAGVPLKIAAKIDKADQEYHDTQILPLLDDPLVEFLGEISDCEKTQFLGDAAALIFPIDWPEPFGLVMIEAMSVGTPVIAFCHGSVPEIIEGGLTGFIVDNIEDAIAAVPRALALNRQAIRQRFEERFAVERMARDYIEVYERILSEAAGRPGLTRRQPQRATVREAAE